MNRSVLRFAARHFWRDRAPGWCYLASRGLSVETMRTYGVGAARNEWRRLRNAATRDGFPLNDLTEAGLIRTSERSKSPYDVFRGRVMFPVFSPMGRVLGFGGRILPDFERDGTPKYINSPATETYDKSRLLYGLHQARVAIRETGMAFLVEGYTDVLAMREAGYQQAVATCGTALTLEHAHLLAWSGAHRVFVAFDGDRAGIEAAGTAAGLLRSVGLEAPGVVLPEGQDPAGLLASHGRRAVWDAIAEAEIGASRVAV
ncbi:MAG: toprim domain-containing protein [Bacteroidota bacterium]